MGGRRGGGTGAWDKPRGESPHMECVKPKEWAEALAPAKKLAGKAWSAIPRPVRPPAPATLVELIASRPGSVASAMVEMEGPRERMRIEFNSLAPAQLVPLSRTLRDRGA